MFSCNLPPVLLAEWPGSFTSYCAAVTRGWNADTEIRVSTESWPLRRKFSRRSFEDSNPGPSDHESGALTTNTKQNIHTHPTQVFEVIPFDTALVFYKHFCNNSKNVLIKKHNYNAWMLVLSTIPSDFSIQDWRKMQKVTATLIHVPVSVPTNYVTFAIGGRWPTYDWINLPYYETLSDTPWYLSRGHFTQPRSSVAYRCQQITTNVQCVILSTAEWRSVSSAVLLLQMIVT